MRDRGWILAQFIVAVPLLVLSLVGIIGMLAFDAAEFVFTFGGAIQAFAVFPGTVLSLVVNGLVMRMHREAGLSRAEKILLGIQFVFIAAMVGMHFWNEGVGVLWMLWPVHVILSIVVCIVAIVRNVSLRNTAANPYVPPVVHGAPPAPPA